MCVLAVRDCNAREKAFLKLGEEGIGNRQRRARARYLLTNIKRETTQKSIPVPFSPKDSKHPKKCVRRRRGGHVNRAQPLIRFTLHLFLAFANEEETTYHAPPHTHTQPPLQPILCSLPPCPPRPSRPPPPSAPRRSPPAAGESRVVTFYLPPPIKNEEEKKVYRR